MDKKRGSEVQETFLGENVVLSVDNISKMYPLYNQPRDRLKQSFANSLPSFLAGEKRKYHRELWALHNISFKLKRGEALGIIGRNGSGKSTLLQIIAGTLAPSTGEVRVNGRTAALLELGSGFNREFTGRENVYMNGSILGLSKEVIDDHFDEIASFADIGEFIDQPVKFYSSGMFVRLAFSVQAFLEPDVLIVDEVLSVGDIFFRQKCHQRMEQLQANNTAILFVSHNMEAVEKYCNRAMLLEKGKCIAAGDTIETIRKYYHQSTPEKEIPAQKQPILSDKALATDVATESMTFGADAIPDWPSPKAYLDLSSTQNIGDTESARCTVAAICDADGKPSSVFRVGETAYLYFEFEVFEDLEIPIGGIAIINSVNITVHARNSLQLRMDAPNHVPRGSRLRFRQTVELGLAPGEYTFLVSLATIAKEDYLSTPKDNYMQLHAKIRPILRVLQPVPISITRHPDNPFYGYVDLKGACRLTVYSQADEQGSREPSLISPDIPSNAFYLLSYPRSGNTWLLNSLRMLFGAIRGEAMSSFKHYANIYGDPTSFYIKTEEKVNPSRPVIIKSHVDYETFESKYPERKRIYLFRDGRDVLLSFYFYEKAFGSKKNKQWIRIGPDPIIVPETSREIDFVEDEFTNFLQQHLPDWVRHVAGWIQVPDTFVLTYEDLHEDYCGKLSDIIAFLDLELSNSVQDVKRVYVDEFKQYLAGSNNQFFRKGAIGDWRNYYTPDQLSLFDQMAGNLMKSLNYR